MRTFSFLQYVHAPGLRYHRGSGGHVGEERTAGWMEEWASGAKKADGRQRGSRKSDVPARGGAGD
ncbi:hypothetical protein FA95DRAFT_1037351 [Auriscalpium vulgare]|uniref:Uncharacterized protein n=1 Tax=Auriscalpium vulgare TaxID=40419 RepID=A0ACB8RW87_9AGAM|nr:hypothetical protein FA95DRAFT_1037351 [Auriscalpium vulgare]